MTSRHCFNIRVYGVCIRDNCVLLSDEFVMNMDMTKFPGGGLEYGEGTVECLRRECREEMGFEIEVREHLYTTDFFQKARFFENTQLISIYYTFDIPDDRDVAGKISANQSFRWVPLETLRPDDLTFPIDQKVAKMIMNS